MARRVFIITVAVLAVIGVFYFLPQEENQAQSYQDITVQEFDNALEEDPFVVDVHTPEQDHIQGTDLFIDYTKVEDNLDKFPQDKNAEILVYCRSGSMSTQASQVLADAGYKNVKNLIGGKMAYDEAHQGVSITPQTDDLGTVIYGEVATTDFTLTNNTKAELNITNITTSCSCTSAEMEKTTLSPGESTNILVSFDPAVHKDDTDLGDITRTIYIETDNINFPRLDSSITARVIKN